MNDNNQDRQMDINKILDDFILIRNSNFTAEEKVKAVAEVAKKHLHNDEEYKKTAAYAYEKIKECSEAYKKHLIKKHNDDFEHQKLNCTDECINEDMSDFKMDEMKTHMRTMMGFVKETLLGKDN